MLKIKPRAEAIGYLRIACWRKLHWKTNISDIQYVHKYKLQHWLSVRDSPKKLAKRYKKTIRFKLFQPLWLKKLQMDHYHQSQTLASYSRLKHMLCCAVPVKKEVILKDNDVILHLH